ncbi:hypothetical protein CK203_040597 [Vitis vinifera]|uniref:Retrotransposon Copia-like N-terminal domain-containing protein n=1 Tax=Vitis vinifera TaxID=29760 RepID=A0A438HHX8_VITVI|nr:hypothetical protein CK203_040597 [Vitis vinifera]
MEVNISPAIANPNPLSSTRFVPINFNHSLSVKLDNKNFLIWKQQIVSMIRGYGLQKFVFSDDEVLVQFLTREDVRSGKETKEFLEWEQQDQLLLSWLLSFVSESILPRLEPRQNSSRLNFSIPRRKVQQLMNSLRRSSDYESFVTSVTLRNDDFLVEKIEALLMAHESRVEKNNNSLDSSPSAHVASFNPVEKGNRGDFGRRGGFNGSRGFNWNDNGRSNRGGFRGRGNKGAFQARLLGTLTIRMKNQYANCVVPQNLSGRNPYPQANYSFSPQVHGVIPTPEVFGDDNWYPDFGASNHVTPNPTNLMKSVEFAGQNQQVKNEESYEESWAKLRIHLPRVNPDCKEKKQRESAMKPILDDSRSQQSNSSNGVQFGVETRKLQPLQANHSELKEAFCKVLRNHPFVVK